MFEKQIMMNPVNHQVINCWRRLVKIPNIYLLLIADFSGLANGFVFAGHMR